MRLNETQPRRRVTSGLHFRAAFVYFTSKQGLLAAVQFGARRVA